MSLKRYPGKITLASSGPMTPKQFAQRIKSDQVRYARIIAQNNLGAD